MMTKSQFLTRALALYFRSRQFALPPMLPYPEEPEFCASAESTTFSNAANRCRSLQTTESTSLTALLSRPELGRRPFFRRWLPTWLRVDSYRRGFFHPLGILHSAFG